MNTGQPNVEFPPLAARLKHFSPSPIAQIFALAKALKERGQDVIDLCIGEPDFDTPDHVKWAAAEAMARGETKYTVLDGTAQMKDAVVGKFKRENGLSFERNEIHIGAGAKPIIYTAFAATISPGDEVILPTPTYASYPELSVMAGAKVVTVACHADQNFILTPEQLEASLTPRSRWLILNSPSNPAGATYSSADYQKLAEVLLRYPDVWVMSDEIYEHIAYCQSEYVSFLNAVPELRSRTLVLNGVSKAHAMTGWRIGYAAGPKRLIDAMRLSMSYHTSHPASISQAAAIAALNGPQDHLLVRKAAYLDRRNLVMSELSHMRGLRPIMPGGAFYIYVECSEALSRLKIGSSAEFALTLLEKTGVAVTHGAAFLHDPYFRISFAASIESLGEACARLGRFVAQNERSSSCA